MKKRIAIVGAGAVGCYLGGHLARTGNDVTLLKRLRALLDDEEPRAAVPAPPPLSDTDS